MRTKIYGKHVFECDACGETLETDTEDFAGALQIMRSAKWQSQQIGSDWVHTCFGCRGKSEHVQSQMRAARRTR